MPLQIDCLRGWQPAHATAMPEALEQHKHCVLEGYNRRSILLSEKQLKEHGVSACVLDTQQ